MKRSGDNGFEVRLGRIRSASGARKVKGFFRSVSKNASRFSGSRHAWHRSRSIYKDAQFHRRVIVKAHIVRMDANGKAAQRRHLDYIERDGTGRNGEPGVLYNKDGPEADKDAFLENGKGDRHQFRIIISPADANDLSDLTAFTRDLVREMENDLGTKLEWIAVNHYDTGQSHTHLVISGKRDDGGDLVMPREYIAYGIRKRAQELVDLELGPVSEIDGRRRLASMVRQERLTQIDQTLLPMGENGVVDLSAPPRIGAAWKQQLARMRVRHLASLGIAEPLGKGRWRINPEAEATLKRMGERGDIIKAMHQAMGRRDDLRMMDAGSIFDPSADGAKAVTGEVLKKGLADDVNDRAYIVIDTMDAKPVYVIVGGEEQLSEFAKGQIVTAAPPATEARASDHTIAKIARASEGRYSAALHMKADNRARPEFVEAHIRRLEAMRRAGHAERRQDGVWIIPDDYTDRAARFEQARALQRPANITVHSSLDLTQMTSAMGATWLDEHLRDFDDAAGARGFGRKVEEARAQRRLFLTAHGFIKQDQKRLSQAVLEALKTRDLEDAGAELAGKLGKSHTLSPGQGRIEGIYTHSIDRPSGKFAVIERARDFSLVPRRDVLERNRGKAVSGLFQDARISWRLTRGRGIS